MTRGGSGDHIIELTRTRRGRDEGDAGGPKKARTLESGLPAPSSFLPFSSVQQNNNKSGRSGRKATDSEENLYSTAVSVVRVLYCTEYRIHMIQVINVIKLPNPFLYPLRSNK